MALQINNKQQMEKNKTTEIIKFKVWVRCMTYNQAHYIEDAMNGFTMQQTDFPFVCTIVDDGSIDGEPEVIQRYLLEQFNLEGKNIVRTEETDDYVLTFAKHNKNHNCYFAVYFLKYNHYSIRKPKLPYLAEWEENCKYIALCEGDDYWTDPKKLQIQADFLEKHHDYTMCFHRAKVLCEIPWKKAIHCETIEDRDYSAVEIFRQWTIATASIFVRPQIFRYKTKGDHRILNGDIILILKCFEQGKVRGISKEMSVYRVHGKGVSHDKSRNKERLLKYPAMYDFINENFSTIPVSELKKRKGYRYLQQVFMVYPPFSKQWLRTLVLAIENDPLVVWHVLKNKMNKVK